MNQRCGASFAVGFRLAITLFAFAGGAPLCLAAPEITLYDVDFNGPPHAIGLTPAFGAGAFPRITPTAGGQISQPIGTAEVVAASALLPDRPVRLTAFDGTPLDPVLGGSNLEFQLNDASLLGLDRFHAQVDVQIADISTSAGLSIFFDAPSIHKVEFSPGGAIRVIDATGVNQVVGIQAANTPYTVKMTFDRAAEEWWASINDVTVWQGAVDDTNLVQFRIAMTSGSSTTTSAAFVDNIRITAEVPEPATLALLGIVIAGGGLSIRRRREE